MVLVDQESWNTMVNKHYPPQFKADAVALYRSRPGATIAQIADDLGVNRETLRGWVRADDQGRGAGPRRAQPAAATGEAVGAVEQENAELRRRIRELEEERDILRKAARYFAGETRW
jgi:transposase